jgi:hypothetical protein
MKLKVKLFHIYKTKLPKGHVDVKVEENHDHDDDEDVTRKGSSRLKLEELSKHNNI